MMLIEIYYPIILILGHYVLLWGFELGEELLDVSGVDDNFYNTYTMNTSSCITDMNDEWSLLWDMLMYFIDRV